MIKVGDKLYYNASYGNITLKKIGVKIIDENRNSWITHEGKINKKTLIIKLYNTIKQCYTAEGWEEMVEKIELREKIKKGLHGLDLTKLRLIAEMV